MPSGSAIAESSLALWDDGANFEASSVEGDSSDSESSRDDGRASKSKRKGTTKKDKKTKVAKKDGQDKSRRKPRSTTAVTFSSRYTTWKKVPVQY